MRLANPPKRPLALIRASGPADIYVCLLGAYRVGGAEATFDRWSPLGAVLPTKWTGSLPPTALGVMTHVPPQAPRATLAPVFESTMYVNPPPIAPRMQKLVFTGV